MTFEPLAGLSSDENNVLRLKYESQPLGSLSATELEFATRLLILKIYTITGWAVPGDELKNILVDQLSKKIKESYPNVNEKEVEYAFRQNLTVKDWGKSMNLVLIDEVLSGYLERRADVSKAEERYRLEPPKSEVEEMPDEDFISSNKFVYKTTKNFKLVSVKCFDILIKSGAMKKPEGEERERIMKTARANFFSIENKDYTTVLTHDEIERFILQDCKKIAVCEYWNNEK